MPAICPGHAARKPWTRSGLASSSLPVFFSRQAQSQQPAAHRGRTLLVACLPQSLVVLGDGVVVVRGNPCFQPGQLLCGGQRHAAATVGLGRHAATFALATHQAPPATLAHPKARRHRRLTALAALPSSENAFAQVQGISFCHPGVYPGAQANSPE